MTRRACHSRSTVQYEYEYAHKIDMNFKSIAYNTVLDAAYCLLCLMGRGRDAATRGTRGLPRLLLLPAAYCLMLLLLLPLPLLLLPIHTTG